MVFLISFYLRAPLYLSLLIIIYDRYQHTLVQDTYTDVHGRFLLVQWLPLKPAPVSLAQDS